MTSSKSKATKKTVSKAPSKGKRANKRTSILERTRKPFSAKAIGKLRIPIGLPELPDFEFLKDIPPAPESGKVISIKRSSKKAKAAKKLSLEPTAKLAKKPRAAVLSSSSVVQVEAVVTAEDEKVVRNFLKTPMKVHQLADEMAKLIAKSRADGRIEMLSTFLRKSRSLPKESERIVVQVCKDSVQDIVERALNSRVA